MKARGPFIFVYLSAFLSNTAASDVCEADNQVPLFVSKVLAPLPGDGITDFILLNGNNLRLSVFFFFFYQVPPLFECPCPGAVAGLG